MRGYTVRGFDLIAVSVRRGERQRACLPNKKEATLTGLEPATTGSTVRYSNQLSYSANDSSAVVSNGRVPSLWTRPLLGKTSNGLFFYRGQN